MFNVTGRGGSVVAATAVRIAVAKPVNGQSNSIPAKKKLERMTSSSGSEEDDDDSHTFR